MNPTRTEKDFVDALDRIVRENPRKDHVFILDNLNIHVLESLVRYVAGKIGYDGDLGVKGRSGILKDMESRAGFLNGTSHSIRFSYVPIHCSWMNQIEIWFGVINRQLLKRKSFLSVEDLEQSIRDYIEQYNLYFAHPYEWSYNEIS